MEINEQEEYKKEMESLQCDLDQCTTDSDRINVLRDHHRNMLSKLVSAHNLLDRRDSGWRGFHDTTRKSVSATKGRIDPFGVMFSTVVF